MKPRLVAFTGKAGAGKDTAALALIRAGFTKVAFADPLKDATAAMLGVPRAQLEYRDWKERTLPGIGKSPRYLMQTLGTEWGRALIHEDIWVRLAMERVDKLLAEGIDVVMTDCRFDNEALAVRERGGHVALIRRPSHRSTAPVHASEAGLDSYLVDQVIVNDSADAEDFILKVALELNVAMHQPRHGKHDASRYSQEMIDEAEREPRYFVSRRGEVTAAPLTAMEERLRKERIRANTAGDPKPAIVERKGPLADGS